MEKSYTEKQLRGIAEECQEFEHIINAMGYGYSLLNVSATDYVRRCTDCTHWLGGSCNIFQKEVSQWE
ncbi:hypothetical protein [Sporomusa malonica]|uniref:Uncharacterized protein n=1 Tax=Sporomusa malonica TaxID=112901 RepID=A0A1W2A576_9FIRM|nr:hypothetical protein [Sporomusa malonica]SMC55827.1 hypothetical protein SAMN04488500_10549 [Sporomusa malonica]